MSVRWDVLGFGAVAVDDLLYVDHYPPLDSKAAVRATERHGGGLAGTALVAAARLGASAAFCGVLGDDDLSRFTLHELEREGVDCSPVIHQPDARPVHSIVIVERGTGGRSIFFSQMGVMEVPTEQISDELIGACRVLFVDYTVIESGTAALRRARRFGIPVVGDVEGSRDRDVTAFAAEIDHLIIGVEMAERLCGESDPAAAVARLSGPDRACCVVTAGRRGCWYAERGGAVQHVPALEIEAVDTTGCGDVFHGAYAASLARGEPVRTAIRVATIAAGIKATQPGGRAGIPGRARVDEILRQCEPRP